MLLLLQYQGEEYEFSEWSNGQTANPIILIKFKYLLMTATFFTRND